MKAFLCVIVVSAITLGCATHKTKYGTVIKESFTPGIYATPKNSYSCGSFNRKKMEGFLEALPEDRFSDGDIVEVDGLKWKKMVCENWVDWEPYPNPPIPTREEGESVAKHTREYAQWIQDHPHFGYPPIPLPSISMGAPLK